MLSVYASRGSLVEEGAIRRCLEYVVKEQSKMAIMAAAVIHTDGNMAACTKQFRVSATDFQNIKHVFLKNDSEQLSFQGVTYCVKSRSRDQLISFNGKYYLIVCRSAHAYIITCCQSRQMSARVAELTSRVANKLRERNS